VGNIGHSPAIPAAAEAAHAVADIQEEGFALLLTVVADVDAGGDLLTDDVPRGGLASCVKRGFIHIFPICPTRVQLGQKGRTRQAAGMRGEDTMLASDHCLFPSGNIL
jgi:hypothetical protein